MKWYQPSLVTAIFVLVLLSLVSRQIGWGGVADGLLLAAVVALAVLAFQKFRRKKEFPSERS